MVARLKGKFLEQGTFTCKTGKVVPYVQILTSDNSVTQVQNFVPKQGIQKFEDIEVDVRIASTKFGLLVRAFTK